MLFSVHWISISHRPDEISPYVLECAETLDKPLEMCKKLTDKGLVPKEWNRANVPILENGDSENALNFHKNCVDKWEGW